MPRYLFMFDTDNAPAIAVSDSSRRERYRPMRLSSVVAEFDGEDHLEHDLKLPVLNLFVVAVTPRNPERPTEDLRTRLYVSRDRIVSVVKLPKVVSL